MSEMNMHEQYERTELEIIRFMTADVITTSDSSNFDPEQYEGGLAG